MQQVSPSKFSSTYFAQTTEDPKWSRLAQMINMIWMEQGHWSQRGHIGLCCWNYLTTFFLETMPFLPPSFRNKSVEIVQSVANKRAEVDYTGKRIGFESAYFLPIPTHQNKSASSLVKSLSGVWIPFDIVRAYRTCTHRGEKENLWSPWGKAPSRAVEWTSTHDKAVP